MNVAHKVESVTPEEFEAMEKDEHFNYELIDGMVLMSPRPAMPHQNVSGNVYHELRNILKGKTCKPIQEIDLALDGNMLVPDILVICNDSFQDKRYEKPPLIVIEILSPSSASRDYVTKRYKYEMLGIQEYWIVSPEEKCVTVWDFVNHAHKIFCDNQVKSFILPEIVIAIADIFA